MRYEWLDGYLLSFPGAEKDYKPEWGWFRYMVRGKLFAAIRNREAIDHLVLLIHHDHHRSLAQGGHLLKLLTVDTDDRGGSRSLQSLVCGPTAKVNTLNATFLSVFCLPGCLFQVRDAKHAFSGSGCA